MKKQTSKNKKSAPKKVTTSVVRGGIGLKPLADRLIIKEEPKDEMKKTDAGLFVPNSGEKDTSSRKGEVVAVGPGRYDDGEIVPMTLKVGDKVVFQWGEKVKFDGQDYFIVREGDVLGVLR